MWVYQLCNANSCSLVSSQKLSFLFWTTCKFDWQNKKETVQILFPSCCLLCLWSIHLCLCVCWGSQNLLDRVLPGVVGICKTTWCAQLEECVCGVCAICFPLFSHCCLRYVRWINTWVVSGSAVLVCLSVKCWFYRVVTGSLTEISVVAVLYTLAYLVVRKWSVIH